MALALEVDKHLDEMLKRDDRHYRNRQPMSSFTDVLVRKAHTGTLAPLISIPRLVWPLLPPVGRSGKAAVIHD
jgi:hypothetical protein